MIIRTDTLRNASARAIEPKARSLADARNMRLQTAFLCHSHRDADLAKGFVSLLLQTGWRVYVDWADAEMPDTPNAETAARIRGKIVELFYFLFLATPNSTSSRWCPWEIGYADGKKPIDQIVVIPTQVEGKSYGNEYLELYRHVEMDDAGRLRVWRAGREQAYTFIEQL